MTSSKKHTLPEGRSTLIAHDVRHLCKCDICGELADDRMTIRPRGNHFGQYFPAKYKQNAHWHPRCFVEQYSEAAIWDLAREERMKFTLGDVSFETMMRLVDDA